MRFHGFTNEDIDTIVSEVKSCSNWQCDNDGIIRSEEDGAQFSMSYSVARQWYTNSWVSQEGIPNVLYTKQGSLAGTPFVDLAYTFAMSRVLKCFRSSMQIDGLSSKVNVNGNEHDVGDVSYVDDVTVLIVVLAPAILEKVSNVIALAINLFASFSMELNFAAGKSECVIDIRGKEKAKAVGQIESCGRSLAVEINDYRRVKLLFPRAYKHVGTRWGINLNAEVATRCSMMVKGAVPLRSAVLNNMGVNLSRRLSILGMYILTKGTFQCSTWTDLSPFAVNKFHSIILCLYRHTIGCKHGKK